MTIRLFNVLYVFEQSLFVKMHDIDRKSAKSKESKGMPNRRFHDNPKGNVIEGKDCIISFEEALFCRHGSSNVC